MPGTSFGFGGSIPFEVEGNLALAMAVVIVFKALCFRTIE
jgi:hypothetical protein